MIAVITDVRWQISSVSPSYDYLFGAIGGLPIDFEFELVGLDQARLVGEVAKLSKEEDKSVSSGKIIPEPAVGPRFNATRDCAIDEIHRASVVPILRKRCVWHERENENTEEPVLSHFRPISQSLGIAATAALLMMLASCSDLTTPPVNVFGIADLQVLAQQANAPAPPSESFWVSNSRQTIVRLNHPDNFNTLFLELSFPSGCMTSLDGAALSDTDSVEVTVDPRAAEYGFVLSPSSIQFSSGAAPTATFSFSVYADASAGDNSATYASRTEYVAALDIWRETSVDEWQVAPNSGTSGVDAVTASLERSGRFVLAAPR